MSDTTPPPSGSGPAPDGTPSEAELRKYLEQLRSLPVEQLVAETLSSLLNAAQAKLGRNDARLLIDLAALALDHARPSLSADLAGQVDRVLGQLRLGQVEAERAPARAGGEPNDLPGPPAAPAGSQSRPAAPASPAPPAATPPGSPRSPRTPSGPPPKLWLPGRDF